MDGFIVEKESVSIFPVVAERLAVIGHHRDHRAVVQSACPQLA